MTRSRRDTYLILALALVAALLAGLGVWIAGQGQPEGSGPNGTGGGNGSPGRTASGARAGESCAPTVSLEPPCGAWWGAYVPYAKNGSLKDPIHALEKKIGRKLDLVYTYHDMSNTPADGRLLTPDEKELGKDRMLMMAWESTVWTEPHHKNWTERQLGWRDIAAGKYDAEIIDPQARRLKAYGKRVFFSFDQETDFRTPDAGTPAEFVAAYRHIHDRFAKLGVDNAVWVWTVSGYLGHEKSMKELYPGDDYVDWVGMDQYNYFLCHDSKTWLDFDRSVRPSYVWLRENISATKPFMLSEFSTAPDPAQPDRQRGWYSDIPEQAKGMPEVKALVQWNQPIEGTDCDLTVNKGPALDGYRQAGRDDYFNQPVPSR